jgi:hypothetical protein
MPQASRCSRHDSQGSSPRCDPRQLGDDRGGNDPDKPISEWNHVELVAKGGDITYFLNDQKILEATDGSYAEGRIMFQSEGAEIFSTDRIASAEVTSMTRVHLAIEVTSSGHHVSRPSKETNEAYDVSHAQFCLRHHGLGHLRKRS